MNDNQILKTWDCCKTMLKSIKIFHSLLFGLFIFFFISLYFVGASVFNYLLYIIANLSFVYFPGSLLRRILKKEYDNQSFNRALSFCLGFSLLIFAYMTLSIMNLRSLGYYLFLPMSALELFLNRKKIFVLPKELEPKVLYPYIILFFIAIWGMVLANPLVSSVHIASFYQDYLYHIGNVNAFSQNFPAISPRVSGLFFKYHYFNDLYHGAIKYYFQISGFEQIYYHSFSVNLFFLVLSLNGFAYSIFKDRKRSVIYPFLFLFLSSLSLVFAVKGGSGKFMNYLFLHLLTNVNAMTITLIFVMVFSTFIVYRFERSVFSVSDYIIVFLFSIMISGIKGPAGIMIGAVLMVILLLSLIQRQKNTSLIFVNAILFFTGFLLVYFLMLKNGAQSTLEFSPAYTVLKNAKDLRLNLNSENGFVVLAALLLIPVHLFFYLPFSSFLYYKNLNRSLKSFFSLSLRNYYLHGMVLSGIIATYMLKHLGQSQMYFLMISTPYITILAQDEYYRLKETGKGSTLKMANILAVLSMITILFSMLYFGIEGVKGGRAVISGKTEASLNSVTKLEVEGLEWLRKNSCDEDLFLSNRIDKGADDHRYFYYTVFSERNSYLEGWGYASDSGIKESILQEKITISNHILKGEDSIHYMRENNIDFLLISRYGSYSDVDRRFDLIKVFENSDITIFKL